MYISCFAAIVLSRRSLQFLDLYNSQYIYYSSPLLTYQFSVLNTSTSDVTLPEDKVTVPGNNSLLGDEQDFEVSITTTILNSNSLVDGSPVHYLAYVQTSNDVITRTAKETLMVNL